MRPVAVMTRKSRIMCFLGVDIGGTSVRSLVTDASGKILGYRRIARVSCESLWQAINDCLGAVLAQSSVVHVEAAVVGAAGAGPTGNHDVCQSVEKAFRAVGLDVTPQVVTDIEIAYWSAAVLGDGSILVAGTGAIAGRFSEWRCVDRRDGAGWLLGDHGSSTPRCGSTSVPRVPNRLALASFFRWMTRWSRSSIGTEKKDSSLKVVLVLVSIFLVSVPRRNY